MAEHLAHALRETQDREVFDSLLGLALELSRTRELATQLVGQDAMPTLIAAFELGFKTEAVALALESVWNIAELVPETVADLSTEGAITTIKALFCEFIDQGHRQQDKELRNQLLVLLSYCVPVEDCHPHFASSGLLEVMMNVAFGLENDQPMSGPVKTFVLTNAHEDFEMKRALMHLVCQLALSTSCVDHICSHPAFVPGLVLYIDERISGHPARRKYTKQQERLLQVQCLACLFTLVPHCPELFMQLEGPQVVLEFMTEQSEETLRSGCLKLLLNIAGLEGYQEELGGRCVAMMLSLIREKGLHPLHIRQDAMCVLARLCWDCDENRAFVGQLNGVPVLIANLDIDGEDNTAQSKTEPMTLSAVDATWAAVGGNSENEVIFNQNGGIGMLLDLLEVAPAFMHQMLVSCLADLLENPLFIASFHRWYSIKHRRGCVAMLLQMWDDEITKREDALRLQTEMQRNTEGKTEVEAAPLPSSNEMVAELTGSNLLTKLHAVMAQLNFATEEKLDAHQQKRLLEVERYISLEDAKLWKRFADELLEDGIRPVTPDNRRLEDRFKRDEKIAEELDDLVDEVEERDEEEKDADLRKFYHRVRLEQEAKNSTARRINQGVPTSTRTKIIVDSHKAQVFPALINPLQVNNQQSSQPSGAGAGASGTNAATIKPGAANQLRPLSATGGGGASREEQDVDAFLGDETTTRMVHSRPSSRGGLSSGPPVGSAINAVAGLRAQ